MRELIDTNYLIRPGNSVRPAGEDLAQVQSLAVKRGAVLVVADSLFADLWYKRPENWLRQFQKLKYLARSPEIVHVARGAGEMLRAEALTGIPPRRILDRVSTEKFRRLLRTGCEDPRLIDAVLVGDKVEDAIRAAASTRASAETITHHRARFRDIVKEWAQQSDMSVGQLGTSPQLATFIADRARLLVEQPHKPEYKALREPQRYAVRSMRVRILASAFLLAVTDLVENRTQYGSDVHNTHLDLEHVIIASYCDTLHSSDKPQLKLYEGLRQVLAVLQHRARYS